MATGCFTLEVIVDYMIGLTQTAWAALWRCKYTGTPARGGACYYCRDVGMMLNSVKSLHRLFVWICSDLWRALLSSHLTRIITVLQNWDVCLQTLQCRVPIVQRYPTSIHAPGCAVHVPFRAVHTPVHAKAGGRVRGVRGPAGCYQRDLGGCYQGGEGRELQVSFTFLVTGTMELQLNSIVEYTLGCI